MSEEPVKNEWVANLPTNAVPFYPAPKILLDEKTQNYRKAIKNAMRCNDAFMAEHIDELIIWLFSHTQGLPASLNDHHRTPYGLFYHSLDVSVVTLNKIKADNSFFPDDGDLTITKDRARQEARVFMFVIAICHDLAKVSEEMRIKIHLPREEPIEFDTHRHVPFSNALYFDLLDALDTHDTLDRSDISRCYYTHRHRSLRKDEFHKDAMLPFALKALRETGTQPLSKDLRKHLDWSSKFMVRANEILMVADRISCKDDLATRQISTEELRGEHLKVLRYLARNGDLEGIEEMDGTDEKYFLQRNALRVLLGDLPKMKDWLNAKMSSAEEFVRLLRVTSDVETVTNADHSVNIQPQWQTIGVHKGVLLEPPLTAELRSIAVEGRLEREAQAAAEAKRRAEKAASLENDEDAVGDAEVPEKSEADVATSTEETSNVTSTKTAEPSTQSELFTPTTPSSGVSIDISGLAEKIPAPPPGEGISPAPTTAPKTVKAPPKKTRENPTKSPTPVKTEAEPPKNEKRAKAKTTPKPKTKPAVRSSPSGQLPDSAPRSAKILDNVFQTDFSSIARQQGSFTESGSFLLDKKSLLLVLDEMNCASRDDLTRLRGFCEADYARYWHLHGSSLNRLELKRDYLECIGYVFDEDTDRVLDASSRSTPPQAAPVVKPDTKSNDATPTKVMFTIESFEAFLLHALNSVLPDVDADGTVEIPMPVFHDYVVDTSQKGRALDALKKPGLIDRHTKRTIHVNPSLLESKQWQRS